MRKFFLSFILILAVAGIAVADQNSLEESSGESSELSSELAAETPPEPEYPYPGTQDKDFAQPSSTPPPAKPSPEKNETATSSQANFNLERPKKIDEETGTYYYGTDVEAPTYQGNHGLPAPKRFNSKGHFIYGKDDLSAEPQQKMEGNERPASINSIGDYRYTTETSARSGTASFRIGTMQPPVIENSLNGITYEDLYGDQDVMVILGDYEWRAITFLGQFGLKFTTGLASSSDNGRFSSPLRVNERAEELFTFLTFPNQLTAIYRFQYAENQILVPYLEGGAGYYTFMEIRDDNAAPKFGGAAVTVAAAGAQFLLDWLDRRSVRSLDAQYGINHLWLTAEYRVVLGLNPNYDFSSQIMNAGFLFDF